MLPLHLITNELFLFAEQTATPETVPESESAPVGEPSDETQAPETAVKPEDDSVTPDTVAQDETTGWSFSMSDDCMVVPFNAVPLLCASEMGLAKHYVSSSIAQPQQKKTA